MALLAPRSTAAVVADHLLGLVQLLWLLAQAPVLWVVNAVLAVVGRPQKSLAGEVALVVRRRRRRRRRRLVCGRVRPLTQVTRRAAPRASAS